MSRRLDENDRSQHSSGGKGPAFGALEGLIAGEHVGDGGKWSWIRASSCSCHSVFFFFFLPGLSFTWSMSHARTHIEL